jgi:glycine/D-amino acid oxidase-like deaminating enzyme
MSSYVDCDVRRDTSAVIGAGIAGALIAHGLAEDGHDVVVLDRRDRALGGTAASTALLQYEIDTMLGQLVRTVGPVRARLALSGERRRHRPAGCAR